jgi:Fe2+ or Zn2+ uptake regulation protein/O6-methylguanine-DNA--protein-cysteine methyltransferase
VANEHDPGEVLRARGLRVTPQRRAILGAFSHGADEHLAAEEIHARAAAAVPELGRGTVYAALAELTELGILVARGTPEPVRYETNTAPHQHFRCRLCLRSFDVDIADPPTADIERDGFVVEAITVTAEGICAECGDYGAGLHAAATQVRNTPSPELPSGIAATTTKTPLGPVAVAATSEGVIRVVFENHADTQALAEIAAARRGSRAARQHVRDAVAAVGDFFAGREPRPCAIDWGQLDGAATLTTAMGIARGSDVSYDLLQAPADAGERGQAFGANPIAILIPCHRITRGREVPRDYVGGEERREALRLIERA